jgi:hypothetical protein
MADEGAGGFSKAKLRVDVGETSRTELAFLYNPTEYTVTKGATWNRPQTRGAKSSGRPEFGGTNPQTVQLEIFFDDWEKRTGTVADDVAALLEWTKPTGPSVQRKRPEPPILVFDWGKNPALTSFRGYLKTVTAKYTLFDEKGKALRATANVTLEEVPTEAAKQNPTSGGRHGYRSHVMQEGDSLHSVAYREYGDATLWRALALFNEIDDPMRIAVGAQLLVPDVTEASRLVAR